MGEPNQDIVAALRAEADTSRRAEGDYYAEQYVTDDSLLGEAADEIERLRRLVGGLFAAIETAGYVYRDTDSGPNLARYS